jgi:hypothetical protein
MDKLRAQLNGNWRERIVNGKDTAPDAVAGFEAQDTLARALELPQGGKARSPGPDHKDIE